MNADEWRAWRTGAWSVLCNTGLALGTYALACWTSPEVDPLILLPVPVLGGMAFCYWDGRRSR